MAKTLELTWVAKLRQWRKRRFVNEHLRSLSGNLRKDDLRVEHVSDTPLLVTVHPPLLGQLVDNLLDNACKHVNPLRLSSCDFGVSRKPFVWRWKMLVAGLLPKTCHISLSLFTVRRKHACLESAASAWVWLSCSGSPLFSGDALL